MGKYIDKDAFVAKLKGQLLKGDCSSQSSMQIHCKVEAYNEILSILNTLEVKDGDTPTDAFIEKAIGWIDYNNRNGGCNFNGWEKDFKNYMKGE